MNSIDVLKSEAVGIIDSELELGVVFSADTARYSRMFASLNGGKRETTA